MPFDVTPDQIAALSDEDLRTLVGRLCEAEVRAKGGVPVGITYGGNQTAPDGGIDVRAEVSPSSTGGFIPRCVTGFQVKAQDMPAGAVMGEMRPNSLLRPSIAELAACAGAYIMVSSHGSVADTALAQRRAAMRRAVEGEQAGEDLQVDFYDRTRIASWANGHPAEIIWVRSRVGEPVTGWRPFEDWSSYPESIGTPYVLDGNVRLARGGAADTDALDASNGIASLRDILRTARGTVRLVGLSGVGKTRLVQALFDHMLGIEALDPTSAVYTDVGDGPNPQPLEMIARLEASGRHHVLVVDNCGADLHRRLASKIRHCRCTSLITIEYDVSDDEPEGTDVFLLEPASSDVVQSIIARHYPDFSSAETALIADFADGNARIALALASTSMLHGSCANLTDQQLFERLFHQAQERDVGLLRSAQVLSLVYSFDGETLDAPTADLSRLASLIGVTSESLYTAAAELYRRKLVQRRSRWRAVLPHAIAHRLAKGALREVHPRILDDRLLAGADDRILKSFSRRLGCLHESPEARAIVASWLADDGLLGGGTLNQLGLVILENVAPVSPDGVLARIRRMLSEKTDDVLGNEQMGQALAQILRSLAYEPTHFDEAAGLIARIAAQRERSNNNSDARNVFVSLFHAVLSGTHAPPAQRANLVLKMARGEIPGGPLLALDALDAMLECQHFTSMQSFEFGSRRRDYGLEPRGEEWKNWFRVAFLLVRDFAEVPSIGRSVRHVVKRRLRGLVSRSGVTEDLVVLAKSFAADGGWIEAWSCVRATERNARSAGQEVVATLLADLAEHLRPRSLSERVRAHILPDHFDLLFDLYDNDGATDIAVARAQLDEVQTALAGELAADAPSLFEVLPALVIGEQSGSAIFGRELGRRCCSNRSVWGAIVQEITRLGSTVPSGTFAGFFLRGVAERDEKAAEAALDNALRTPAMHHILIQLQASVGLSEAALDRLIEAAALETVPVQSFLNLSFARPDNPLRGAALRRLLLAVANREGGVRTAISMMRMRLFDLKHAGAELGVEEARTGVDLIGRMLFEQDFTDERLDVAEIVAACFRLGQDDEVALQVCHRIKASLREYKLRPWTAAPIVTAFAKTHATTVLDVFVDDASEDHFDLRALSRERPGHQGDVFGPIPDEVVMVWAGTDPDKRFASLARVVRPWRRDAPLSGADVTEPTGAFNWSPLGLRLIHDAPDPLPVLAAYERRLRPSSWIGSRAAILTDRVPLLDHLLLHPDQRVSDWAVRARQVLLDEASRERDYEDARARDRDQQFEW